MEKKITKLNDEELKLEQTRVISTVIKKETLLKNKAEIENLLAKFE